MSTSPQFKQQQILDAHILWALKQFKKIVTSYTLFHIAMVLAISLELLSIFLLATTNFRSMYFAIDLALLFMTSCSYCILIYYYETKKPQQFLSLKEEFIQNFLNNSGSLDTIQKRFSIAQASFKLVMVLSQKQSAWHGLSKFAFLRQFNTWFHWVDLNQMQEMLMEQIVEEHLAIIEKDATNIQAHSSLANALIALAKLYKYPTGFSMFSKKAKKVLEQKFLASTYQAIEELKIIDDFAPNDPWVHAQLAMCYNFLNDQAKEIHHYEHLNRLRPEDKKISFRLASLYFENGQFSKGLKLYQYLQKTESETAKSLIKHYRNGLKQIFSKSV